VAVIVVDKPVIFVISTFETLELSYLFESLILIFQTWFYSIIRRKQKLWLRIRSQFKTFSIQIKEWLWGQISWDWNRRLNDLAIMRSNYFASFHEDKIPNNFLISLSHLRLTNWSWDQNSLIMLLSFDLMIKLVTNKIFMRSKLVRMLFRVLISWSKCWPPDQYFWTNLISWKVECWSHDCNFDLMKKLNFDLIKFILLTPTIQIHKFIHKRKRTTTFSSNSGTKFCRQKPIKS